MFISCIRRFVHRHECYANRLKDIESMYKEFVKIKGEQFLNSLKVVSNIKKTYINGCMKIVYDIVYLFIVNNSRLMIKSTIIRRSDRLRKMQNATKRVEGF